MADKQKVLFFTAGSTPTPEELTELDKMATMPGIDLQVRNASLPHGEYDTLEEADAVMDFSDGSLIPEWYPEEDYPRFDAAAYAADTLPPTSMAIASGVKFTGPAVTGTYVDGYTATIVDGAITELVAS